MTDLLLNRRILLAVSGNMKKSAKAKTTGKGAKMSKGKSTVKKKKR